MVRSNSESSLMSLGKGALGPLKSTSTIRRALSTLGNMPQLQHPKPVRSSFHEIIVHGYGNGTNTVFVTTEQQKQEAEKEPASATTTHSRKSSGDTMSSGSVWSESDSHDAPSTKPSSITDTNSRRGSNASADLGKDILTMLDSDAQCTSIDGRNSSCVCTGDRRSSSVYDGDSDLTVEPLSLNEKHIPDDMLLIERKVEVSCAESVIGGDDELERYLSS